MKTCMIRLPAGNHKNESEIATIFQSNSSLYGNVLCLNGEFARDFRALWLEGWLLG